MMDCKRALIESNGDFAAAERRLKEMGLATGRVDRPTNEGRIFTRIVNGKAAIAELTCETDFVARNADFVRLGEKVVEQLMENGSSAEHIEPLIVETAGRLKENMGLGRFYIVERDANELIVDYIHGESGSIGVLVKARFDDSRHIESEEVRRFVFDVALHVAAFHPLYLSPDAVPAEYIDEQKQIFRAQAEKLGKPEKITDGIVHGKLRKHRSEICLLEQPFVKDEKQTVSQRAAQLSAQSGGAIQIVDYIYLRAGA